MGVNVEIDKRVLRGVFIISVDGELDVYTAPHLKDALTAGISQGHKKLVVDLTRVDFLDSTALGVLVGGLKQIRAENGDLHLVMNDPHIGKMFRITGFDGVFSIHSTVDEVTGGEEGDV